VVITKVVDFCPPATVTLAGTLATDGLALSSDTLKPCAQAGYEMDTVAVTGFPPFTDEVKLKLLTGGGVTVKDAFKTVTPADDVSVAVVLLHCGVVAMGTCRYRVPAGTVAVLGTETTDGLLLERLTGHPPEGANAER
jgi:hypothetical protein